VRFWDASAVVPLLVEQEPSAAAARALENDADVCAWWGTPVECGSAIARLERDQILSSQNADAARARLYALAQSWHEVQPSEPVRRTAQRLLRLHSLRALDALQAAAALVLAEHDPTSLGVVCLDVRLAEALRREGFVVDVPT
jgi:predicted nucleic acid-binding protein